MPATTLFTRQVTLTGTPTHLGDVITEEAAGIRLTVPSNATSVVWLGDATVTPETGDPYRSGSSTRLPTTSLAGWYAVTDGADVTITLALALGGNSDNVEWGDAGGAASTAVTALDGEELATETTVAMTADATELLATTVVEGPGAPTGSDPRVAVSIAESGVTLVTMPAPGFQASASPADDAPGAVVRVAGTVGLGAALVPAGEETGLLVGAAQNGPWSVAVTNGPDKPLFAVGTPDGENPERLATEATAAATLAELVDHATTADVQEVRDRLPAVLEGGRLLVETELEATGPLATEAKQDAGNTSLASIDGKTPALVAGRVPVDGSGVTQPISAASLPLPTGASTAANQATGNASLAAIDAGIPTALGQTTAAASMPVVLPASQAAGPLALDASVDGVETLLTNIYGRQGDRRTADAPPATGGQAVRAIVDIATRTKTAPGSPTNFLIVRASPGVLISYKVLLNTNSTVYIFVLDVASYNPLSPPAITTREEFGFVVKASGADPGLWAEDFSAKRLVPFTTGIVIALSTTLATFTPATSAQAAIVAYSGPVPS